MSTEPSTRSRSSTVDGGQHAPATRVVTVATREDPTWAAMVAEHPSDVFHAPAWHQVLYDTYGFEVEGRLLVDATGRAFAGWASCRLNDLRGRRVSGLPFSDYADPLVSAPLQWAALTRDLDPAVPVRARVLRRADVAGTAGFAQVGRARWHGVSLSASVDALWQRVDPGSRRAVRKAEAAGVRVRASTALADVRTYFELHLGVRKRKYGLLAQPYRFFEAIHARFLEAGQGVVLLAEVDGKALAGVVLLRWRDRLYYKFNASDPRALALRPNDLLMWHALSYGRAEGCVLLDLGLSDWDQHGLLRYKRKFASDESEIVFLERPAVTEGAEASTEGGRLLAALTSLLTHDEVADALTERAGDLLYRYFA